MTTQLLETVLPPGGDDRWGAENNWEFLGNEVSRIVLAICIGTEIGRNFIRAKWHDHGQVVRRRHRGKDFQVAPNATKVIFWQPVEVIQDDNIVLSSY
ncbi:hypothetical protein D3C75_955090 [compost metagenome]